MQNTYLADTAALFIGLPSLMAIVLTLTPKAKTSRGMAIKVMSIGMLASSIVLQESFICFLMAAPLFIGVVIIFDWLRKLISRITEQNDNTIKVIAILPFLILSLEGVFPLTTAPCTNIVVVEQIVSVDANQVRELIAHTPDFNQTMPLFLRLGFPLPKHSSGSGAVLGDRRIITFAVPNRLPGDLTLSISKNHDNLIVFDVLSDTSEIANWLQWQEVQITWEEVSPGQTRVTWQITFERLLDPAWYFEPLQEYAVRLSAKYLINSIIAS
ncbi:MAG: hypothetical protein N2D54_09685 [Chloroflexota bacterium]